MTWGIVSIVGAAVLAFLLYVALQPSSYRIERSVRVAAPPAVAFAEVNDLRRWQAWSAWVRPDNEALAEFSRRAEGEGATFSWDGNREVGAGVMRIVESRPHEVIRLQITFERPQPRQNEVLFTFAEDGNGTRIHWIMTGDNDFLSRFMWMFVNVDKLIGREIERGLVTMKAIAERRVPGRT